MSEGITHLVQFTFKKSASAEDIADTCKQFFALQQECLHPDTQKPYVKSVKGGKDCSLDAANEGLTHAFVVEFDSVEDRDYYSKKDPRHATFGKHVGKVAERVVVVDFSDSKF